MNRDIIIVNGKLLSPINNLLYDKKDILIENGIIKSISNNIKVNNNTLVINAEGKIITPGLIDIHTHCYPNSLIGLDPDALGIQRGATTILDAGSSGPLNYDDFKHNFINKAKTKVLTLLNISDEGLFKKHELDSLDKIHFEKIEEVVKQNSDNIVGLKARASQSVVGELGLLPIQMAEEFAQKLNLPLTVHVGNYPPALKDVLNILNKNDIVTHAFHGKKGGIIDDDGNIINEAIEARKRGDKFDVGHGVASFSFKTFEKASNKNFYTDFISTDLHVENYNGPVYNLASVLTKMYNLNVSLEDCIIKTTSDVARHYNLDKIGELKEGYYADLNIISLVDCDKFLKDSIGDDLHISKEIELYITIVSKENGSEVYRHNA